MNKFSAIIFLIIVGLMLGCNEKHDEPNLMNPINKDPKGLKMPFDQRIFLLGEYNDRSELFAVHFDIKKLANKIQLESIQLLLDNKTFHFSNGAKICIDKSNNYLTVFVPKESKIYFIDIENPISKNTYNVQPVPLFLNDQEKNQNILFNEHVSQIDVNHEGQLILTGKSGCYKVRNAKNDVQKDNIWLKGIEELDATQYELSENDNSQAKLTSGNLVYIPKTKSIFLLNQKYNNVEKLHIDWDHQYQKVRLLSEESFELRKRNKLSPLSGATFIDNQYILASYSEENHLYLWDLKGHLKASPTLFINKGLPSEKIIKWNDIASTQIHDLSNINSELYTEVTQREIRGDWIDLRNQSSNYASIIYFKPAIEKHELINYQPTEDDVSIDDRFNNNNIDIIDFRGSIEKPQKFTNLSGGVAILKFDSEITHSNTIQIMETSWDLKREYSNIKDAQSNGWFEKAQAFILIGKHAHDETLTRELIDNGHWIPLNKAHKYYSKGIGYAVNNNNLFDLSKLNDFKGKSSRWIKIVDATDLNSPAGKNGGFDLNFVAAHTTSDCTCSNQFLSYNLHENGVRIFWDKHIENEIKGFEFWIEDVKKEATVSYRRDKDHDGMLDLLDERTKAWEGALYKGGRVVVSFDKKNISKNGFYTSSALSKNLNYIDIPFEHTSEHGYRKVYSKTICSFWFTGGSDYSSNTVKDINYNFNLSK